VFWKVHFEAKKTFSKTVIFSYVIFGTISFLQLTTGSAQNLLNLNTCFSEKLFITKALLSAPSCYSATAENI